LGEAQRVIFQLMFFMRQLLNYRGLPPAPALHNNTIKNLPVELTNLVSKQQVIFCMLGLHSFD